MALTALLLSFAATAHAQAPEGRAATPPGRRWSVQLGAGAGASAGFSTSIAATFGGFAGLRFPLRDGDGAPALSVSLEGRGDTTTTDSVIVGVRGETTQVRAVFGAGTLAPCFHNGGWLLGCFLVTGGPVNADLSGRGAPPETQRTPFFGLGGRVGVEFPFFRGPVTLAVRVALDGWISIVRSQVMFDGEVAWMGPPGAGTLGGYLVTLF